MCKLKSSSEKTSEDNKCSKMIRRMQHWLVFLCAIVFGGTFVIYGRKVKHCTVHYTLDYIISTDSTGYITSESKTLADSIMHEMQKQQKLLEDKYQYFIEQQSNTHDILTIGGVLLSIIVSLVGFFGYKTMHSIEDKAKKIGEDAAQKSFQNELSSLQNSQNRKFLEDTVRPEMNRNIEEAVNKYWGEKGSCIETLQTDVSLLKSAVENIDKKISKKDQQPLGNDEYEAVREPDVFDESDKEL